jgi:hypothetical protein
MVVLTRLNNDWMEVVYLIKVRKKLDSCKGAAYGGEG